MSKMEFGWAGPIEAEKAWDKIGHLFSQFKVYRTKERKGKYQLWRLVEKVGGRLNFSPQPDGDCVSAAARDVLDVLQCTEIASGDRELFKPIFSPYHYYTGRVLIGRGRLKGGPGSLGSWQAEAIKRYGCVPYDTPGLPPYDKRTTSAWGDGLPAYETDPSKFLELGQTHPVEDTARLNSVEEIGDAVENGHPVTVAAQYGYEMTARSDGFHYPNAQGDDAWGHQMSVIGVDWDRQYVEIKNQWGDVHGQLKDFDDGKAYPKGILRVKFGHFRNHLRANSEVYAFSRFKGFPEQSFNFGTWA